MNERHAIFHANAGRMVGTGHLHRSLVLADALARRGWRCAFDVPPDAVDLVPRLAESGHGSARSTDSCDLLVVDDYSWTAAEEARCRATAGRILVLDDLADRPHDCDLLADPSFGRTAADYRDRVPESCTVLAGPHYALLRDEFFAARAGTLDRRRARTGIGRILVTLGGTDPRNVTARVLDDIAAAGIDAAIDIVLGADAPHAEAVRGRAAAIGPHVKVACGVSDMAERMAAADVCIGAAGSTAWERCCLGLPTAMLVLADNQRGIAASLGAHGAAVDLGPLEALDANAIAATLRRLAADVDALRSMSTRAATICDGLGAARVAQALAGPETPTGEAIRLRPAAAADSETVFRWQTLPGIRRFSRNPEPPTHAEHTAWMTHCLEDADRVLSIVTRAGTAVGLVRLDRRTEADATEPEFEVSILIDPDHQGRGIGVAALRLARDLIPGARFVAAIHAENAASRATFRRAEFVARPDGLLTAPGGVLDGHRPSAYGRQDAPRITNTRQEEHS